MLVLWNSMGGEIVSWGAATSEAAGEPQKKATFQNSLLASIPHIGRTAARKVAGVGLLKKKKFHTNILHTIIRL